VADSIEVQRKIAAPPSEIFAVLCDPQGHVAIDSSGMLQGAEGDRVTAAVTASSSTWTELRSTISRNWANTT
jgi:hypothetical protein